METNEMECLSLLEMMEFRAGAGDPAGQNHLEECPRCSAVFAHLPEEIEEVEISTTPVQVPVSVRNEASPEGYRIGQLWRATTVNPEWTFPVALVGPSPESDENLLAVPLVPEHYAATENDLLLAEQDVGYEAFLDMQNLGTLRKAQLKDFLGRLSTEQSQALVSLYQSILFEESRPEGIPTGPPLLSDEDPRLLWADERRTEFMSLWRFVDADVLDQVEQPNAQVQIVGSSREVVGIGSLLRGYFDAHSDTWDRATILEESRIDSAHFEAITNEQLDLTDKTDVEPLARLIHLTEIPIDQVEAPVKATLHAGSGGKREATGETLPMAARSVPGTPKEKVTEALFGDQSQVNETDEAREVEIDQYWAELRRILEDLE